MGLDILRNGGGHVLRTIQGCLILWLCCSAPAYASIWDDVTTKQVNCSVTCNQFPETVNEGKLCRLDNTTCSNGAGGGGPGISTFSFTAVPYSTDEVCDSQSPDYNEATCIMNGGEPVEPDPVEPQDCFENGDRYDNTTQTCVTDCPNGELNGLCLNPPQDDECDTDSPDYKGSYNFGNETKRFCDSSPSCPGGTPGFVNGALTCIPDDYGPPECPSDGVLVIDEYGFVCDGMNDTPEPEPEEPKEPNTDTDGDGQPDEYQRENDPNSTDDAIDRVGEGVGETNNKLDGVNDRLDKLGKGIEGVNENLNEGLGAANDSLSEINEKLDMSDATTPDVPEAGTIAESGLRLKNAVLGHPLISSVTTIPDVAAVTQCPTWTIPGNRFWNDLTIDAHCAAIEGVRGMLSVIFIAMWTLVAGVVFLRA